MPLPSPSRTAPSPDSSGTADKAESVGYTGLWAGLVPLRERLTLRRRPGRARRATSSTRAMSRVRFSASRRTHIRTRGGPAEPLETRQAVTRNPPATRAGGGLLGLGGSPLGLIDRSVDRAHSAGEVSGRLRLDVGGAIDVGLAGKRPDPGPARSRGRPGRPAGRDSVGQAPGRCRQRAAERVRERRGWRCRARRKRGSRGCRKATRSATVVAVRTIQRYRKNGPVGQTIVRRHPEVAQRWENPDYLACDTRPSAVDARPTSARTSLPEPAARPARPRRRRASGIGDRGVDLADGRPHLLLTVAGKPVILDRTATTTW